MKILHIVLSLGKGGAEKLLVDILPFYVAQSHEVSILQLSSIKEFEDYIRLVKDAGISFHSLSEGSFRNIFLIFKLRRFLKNHTFDIVHVHLFPCIYWTALATRLFKNKPVMVFTEHSSQNGRNSRYYLRPIEKYMYNRYDTIIAISEKIRQKLGKWIQLDHKTVYIPNGIDLEKFEQLKPYPASFWEETFSIKPDDIKLLMVARFSHPKDHRTVIEAIANLPDKYHVIFVGDGVEEANIKLFVAECGLSERVHFAGFRLDVPELMKSSDIIILSALYEGMSGVTLEALAARTAFLGTEVPGIIQVVPDDRYLFTKQDAKQLATKIEGITNSPKLAESIVQDGYAFVKSFGIEAMIASHIDLYKRLLKSKEK